MFSENIQQRMNHQPTYYQQLGVKESTNKQTYRFKVSSVIL